MKFIYMNDEQKPVNVFMNGLGSENFVCRLESAQMKSFDYKLPKGAVLWIKKWPDYIMISHVDKKASEELDEKSPQDV